MTKKFDLAIIGGGPGGYVAAIKAAQRGLSVCLIEKGIPGGVCLNWGCIPTKSLIYDASLYATLGTLAEYGIAFDTSGFSYARVHAKSRDAAAKLAAGVTGLLRKNKVTLLVGTGTLTGRDRIQVREGTREEVVEASNIILATGSRPAVIPGIDSDGTQVLSSDDLLALTRLPVSLAIIGGGAIGCEFAYVLNRFGVKVTLLEAANQLLPQSDTDVAAGLARSLEAQGIEIKLNSQLKAVHRSPSRLAVEFSAKDKTETIEVEKILLAVGRRPNSESLGLDIAGVSVTERGHIQTGDFYATTAPGIYAIGDVTEGPALAHVASKAAAIVVDHICGHGGPARLDPVAIPAAVYCEPQVAGFGLTEQQCVDAKLGFVKSVFPYVGVGKAVTIRHTDGFVKLLADKQTGEILGAHLLGEGATELIHELLLAKSGELLVDDIASMIHAHPTLSEAILESAEGVFGRPVHI